MPSALSIVMQSPLVLGELVAEVTLQSGEKTLILIHEGQFEGSLPSPAVRLRLTGLGADVAQHRSTGTPAAPTTSVSAAIEDLFEKGVAVPADGKLSLLLTWGVHCHRPVQVDSHAEHAPDAQCSATRGSRFGSFEHITCAEFIGKNDFGRTLRFGDVEASFDKDTFLKVGKKKLTFGEILALAGDYYAHLDMQAAKEFSWAWPDAAGLTTLIDHDYRLPTLIDDDGAVTTAILTAVDETKDGGSDALDAKTKLIQLGVTTDYPVRRYLALASQNHCHFAAQPATGQIDDSTNEALRLYRAYHERALHQAETAGATGNVEAFFQALIVDAFGCHFLSDLFATGHMRVPRRVLTDRYGVVKGALGMAHDMHCEDNNSGLWLTPRFASHPRIVWRGYGDDHLHRPESGYHFLLVRRAVARSAAEVLAHYCQTTLPAGQRAEDLVPVALPAGTTPKKGDVFPDGKPATLTDPNAYPLYWWLPEKKIVARRVSASNEGVYVNHDDSKSPQFHLPETAAPQKQG